MISELWKTAIIEGPVIVTTLAAALCGAVFLLIRRPTRRWLLTAGIAIGTGIIASVVTWLVAIRTLNLFGTGLGLDNYMWITATFSAVCLAIASLWSSRWWRKAVAAVCIPLFLVAGTLAINANYGINPTLGDLLDIPVDSPIALAPPTATDLADGTLYATWKPPADLPAKGRYGTQIIPNALSGFDSRPAGIYLPPAALVKNPPRLPLVIMMFGQPGHPEPEMIAQVLDPYAAKHHGLAPIVLIPDQLGNPLQDPLCINSKHFGDVETFIVRDAVDWATSHLNITRDHRLWSVAGYSNGGACALLYATQYPGLFNNVISLSGEDYPGSDNPAGTLASMFDGNQKAYDAVKPLLLMKGRSFTGHTAIFTAGSGDAAYTAVARNTAAAVRRHGMAAQVFILPGIGHVKGAVVGGLQEAFPALYPLVGLSAPPAAAH